jgi:hypothetical protein
MTLKTLNKVLLLCAWSAISMQIIYGQEDLDSKYEPFPMDQNIGKIEAQGQKSQKALKILRERTYILGTLSPAAVIDYAKNTHIVIAGSAVDNESDQFFQSAYLRGRMYQELYPQHQVIVLSQPEVVRASNVEVYQRFDVSIVEEKEGKLTGPTLINELNRFERIESLDFYGHSSPWGIKLGKKDAAMSPDDYVAKLKDNFVTGAYATMNGCNGGFSIAPKLSRHWNIPVSGALTGSLFERLQVDGKWYKKPDRTDSKWAKENGFNFLDPLHCYKGGCWRMKPQRNNYSSYWGYFKEGGLSFYKFFCNYENKDGSCEKAMAKSLLSFPSAQKASTQPSLEVFKGIVFDYLCSTAKDPQYFENCKKGIQTAVAKGDLVYQAHPGNALKCNFKGCDAQVVCSYKSRFLGGGLKPGTCRLKTTKNKRPTTLVQEYLSFMKGYELLMP